VRFQVVIIVADVTDGMIDKIGKIKIFGRKTSDIMHGTRIDGYRIWKK